MASSNLFEIEQSLRHHPQIVYELGRLIITAGTAENSATLTLSRLLAFNPEHKKLDRRKYVTNTHVVSGAAMSVKLQQIHATCYLHFGEPVSSEVGKITDRLRKKFSKRNDYVHGLIAATDDTIHVTPFKIISSKSKLTLQPTIQATAGDIKKLADDINQLSVELSERVRSLGVSL